MKRLIFTIAIVLSMSASAAIVATFTGFQEQVQTVTGQFVWKCQYDYFGQKFYRLFRTHCPGTIEVE